MGVQPHTHTLTHTHTHTLKHQLGRWVQKRPTFLEPCFAPRHTKVLQGNCICVCEARRGALYSRDCFHSHRMSKFGRGRFWFFLLAHSLYLFLFDSYIWLERRKKSFLICKNFFNGKRFSLMKIQLVFRTNNLIITLLDIWYCLVVSLLGSWGSNLGPNAFLTSSNYCHTSWANTKSSVVSLLLFLQRNETKIIDRFNFNVHQHLLGILKGFRNKILKI
jgi:hypothetical protein